MAYKKYVKENYLSKNSKPTVSVNSNCIALNRRFSITEDVQRFKTVSLYFDDDTGSFGIQFFKDEEGCFKLTPQPAGRYTFYCERFISGNGLYVRKLDSNNFKMASYNWSGSNLFLEVHPKKG